MKIAWFTPFHKASAIGRFSGLVTKYLSNDAHVDLWVADPAAEELHPTSLRIIRYLELTKPEQFLDEYDLIAYNLGDSAPNHAHIFEMSRRVPGIVILHDYVLHNFLVSYYDRRGELEAYADVMRRWYGAHLRKSDGAWVGELWKVWERNEVIDYPLFEEALVGCSAVVTHADFVKAAVARVASAPITKISLPYEVDTAAPVLSREELGVPQNRILVVTVGNANENKRIHIMLQALAANPDLAKSLIYVVVGSCDGAFGQQLKAAHVESELGDTVRFTGYAADQVLRSFLFHADFCVNMRWPAMEGGSASCAEEMLFGKAAIVTDTGVYRELPGNCVRKVRPEHELEDLAMWLRDLVKDAGLRRKMGEQARRYAEASFNPALYAERFLAFCSEVPYYQPALRLMDVAGRELRRMGVTAGMSVVDTVAKQGTLLMDGDYDSPILRKSE